MHCIVHLSITIDSVISRNCRWFLVPSLIFQRKLFTLIIFHKSMQSSCKLKYVTSWSEYCWTWPMTKKMVTPLCLLKHPAICSTSYEWRLSSRCNFLLINNYSKTEFSQQWRPHCCFDTVLPLIPKSWSKWPSAFSMDFFLIFSGVLHHPLLSFGKNRVLPNN